MKVRVTTRAPAAVAGDVVVQLFEPPLPKRVALAGNLAKNARDLIITDSESLTWLESRRMSAPRILMASMGTVDDRKVGHGVCGNVAADAVGLARQHVLRTLGGLIERTCYDHDIERVVLAPMPEGCDPALVVEGMMLRAHATTEFRPDDRPSTIERIDVCVTKPQRKQQLRSVEETVRIVDATNDARALGDLPSNIGNAPGILKRVRKSAREAGLKVKVISEKEAKRLEMGLLLGVAAGAGVPASVLILEHNADRARDLPTLVLVGKGLTHDTGGYNLKASSALHEMTYDKSGAIAVIGAMHAIASLEVEAHVVGVTPLVENCIDAHAYKPGDILTAMDGTTVYIDNTDAEGRLALADCLTYVKRYEPDAVVDIATLTGACSIALGEPFAGLFCNDDRVRDLLLEAGSRSDDLLWPMPIHDVHRGHVRHHIARLRNTGYRGGGASSAAAFLRHFTDYPWAHIDMAGKGVWASERDYLGAGASGFGCRLLARTAQRFAEVFAPK